MRRTLALAFAGAFVLPGTASAHGIGGVKDLPVPLWLFSYGGALVLVLSFAALGALWKEPRLETPARGRPLPAALQYVLLSRPLRIVIGLLSVLLFVAVIAAALVGERSTATNIAPTFIWVIFWLGLVPIVVVFGNVWRALSPWAAVADAVEWTFGRGRVSYRRIEYRAQWGRWPAAALLFLFMALELVYDEPADPLTLAVAIAAYSLITWYGMMFFGRETWLRNGDPFAVYFEFLSRLSIFAVDEHGDRRQIVVRRPLSGLAARDATPGTVALVAVMLGSVSFDGLSRTRFWVDLRYEAIVASIDYGNLLAMLLNLGALGMTVAAVAGAYRLAVGAAARVARSGEALAGVFVWSLIPIALAYAVAHYFSLFVLQSQYAIPLASDPLGRGWDLFGSADHRVNLAPLSPNTIWYVQVGALVIGHVIGLVVAHDRALVYFRSARTALRTQYALLALMVLYTIGGMWLLSQG
jgi:hypothetical protein